MILKPFVLWGPQNLLWCCNGDCSRRGYVDIDGIGFLCFVCFQRVENEAALAALQLSESKKTPFESHLHSNGLAMITMEFVFGDGWEDQCPCRHCKRSWLESGWTCPANYNRRWYLQILDARFENAGYSQKELYDLGLDWDVLVTQIHDELFGDSHRGA